MADALNKPACNAMKIHGLGVNYVNIFRLLHAFCYYYYYLTPLPYAFLIFFFLETTRSLLPNKVLNEKCQHMRRCFSWLLKRASEVGYNSGGTTRWCVSQQSAAFGKRHSIVIAAVVPVTVTVTVTETVTETVALTVTEPRLNSENCWCT